MNCLSLAIYGAVVIPKSLNLQTLIAYSEKFPYTLYNLLFILALIGGVMVVPLIASLRDWFQEATKAAGFEHRIAVTPLKVVECSDISLGLSTPILHTQVNFQAEGIGIQEIGSKYEILVRSKNVYLVQNGKRTSIKTICGKKTLNFTPYLLSEIIHHLKL